MVQGSCLCGTIRYAVDGPFDMVAHCHCSMCRKAHGAAFATFACAPLGGFRWLSGEAAIETYQSSPNGKRLFCRCCGSPLPGPWPEMQQVFCLPGAFEGDVDVRPTCHLFVGSKAPWHIITDELPQHEAYPPGIDAQPVVRAAIEQQSGVIRGSCLCGDIAYETTNRPVIMRCCHCSRCRRAYGAAHASNVFFPVEGFRWVRVEDRLVDFALPGARRFGVSFCRRCGSKMPRIYRERGGVLVPGGSLDTDPGVRPTMHIYVGSKASWFPITDDVPQFQAAPPAA